MERGELSRAGPDIGVQQQRLHQQNNQFSSRMHGEKKIEGGAEEVAVGVNEDIVVAPRRPSPSPSPSLPSAMKALAQIGLHLHPSCLTSRALEPKSEQERSRGNMEGVVRWNKVLEVMCAPIAKKQNFNE
jgi:hypothetical protein